mmetsp:Transcript_26693/g.39656  ORF Transcript_26693/g.39656 Transcript_26693/m.39656 type:complete len:127 (-) Transcript_26693:34-414(-)
MWGTSNRSDHSYNRVPTDDHNHDDERTSDGRIFRGKISEQDESLGILESSIQRLGKLSLNISNEIKEQNKMLDRMDADVDDAQNQADIITEKTRQLIKKSGGPKYFTAIVILTIILIILIFLVIYT